MKITFVSVHIEDSPRAVPLGPAMLASALNKKFGDIVSAHIINLYLEDSIDGAVDKIRKEGAEYIGFSMFVWNRDKILEIAENLKAKHSGVRIFLGGPEATADDENLIKKGCIDFIIKGEGESSIVKVFEYFEKNDGMKSPPEHLNDPVVPELQNLDSPYLDGTLNPDDYSGILWELSRGCPFKCDFCFESRGAEGVRRFPMDRIKAELEFFEKKCVPQIFVLDPTFNYNPKVAKQILGVMIDTAPDIHYCMEIRSEFLDAEMAGMFSALNCSLQIGLQSADPSVLKNINRKIDKDVFKEKILYLHEAEVTYGFDLIYGLPGDTIKGFRESLDFAMSLVPNHLDIFPLSVLPGTHLWETAPSFKLEFLKGNPYTVISTPEFSKKDMETACDLAAACDIFYNQGKAVPWFAIMIENLCISPSDFFMAFHIWVLKNKKNTDHIIHLQREFLIEIFSVRKNTKSGLIASDIAAYFGHASFLIENDMIEPVHNPGRFKYILNPESSFVVFNHNPADLMNHLFSGITNIDELSVILPEERQEVLFYNNENEIEVRIFSDFEIEFLKNSKKGFDTIPEDEALKEFFFDAISENIILKMS